MNFIKFTTGNTNIFPMANSTTGGQLLNEFNMRSRESVGTPQDIKYMVGPSYTHSMDDFAISYETDSTGDIMSKQNIQISEGRALINGHFIESLAPVVIDIAAANAQINKNNKGLSPENKKSLLKGHLAIGLRMMYSTEMTTTGSLLVEDNDGMFLGLQVVILPENEFFTPIDKPNDPNSVTAHLRLGTFNYINGVISTIKQDQGKIQILTADRIGNVGSYLSGTYVSKTGLSGRHHYVYAAQQEGSKQNRDTWCNADDALMIWDANPQAVTEGDHSAEAHFQYNNLTEKTSLVIPHKQPDALKNTKGIQQYFPDKVLDIPVASYAKNTGGVVDKTYTKNIKNVINKIDRFYLLPNGGMKLYVDVLDSLDQLPKLSMQANWKPGDYVLVGQDNLYESANDVESAPSTMYVILPGKVKSISYHSTISGQLEQISDSDMWNDVIAGIVRSINWRVRVSQAIEENGNVTSIDWNDFVENQIYGLSFLNSINWTSVIDNAIAEHQDVDNIKWEQIITQVWQNAYTEYVEKRDRKLSEAQNKLQTVVSDIATFESNIAQAEADIESADAQIASAEDDIAVQDELVSHAEQDKLEAQDVISYEDTVITENQAILDDPGSTAVQKAEAASRIEEAKSRKSEAVERYQDASDRITEARKQQAEDEKLIDEAEALKADANQRITLNRQEITRATADKEALEAQIASLTQTKQLVEELFSEGRYFPVEDLANKIKASIDLDGVNWTEFIVSELANGIANSSEIDWNDMVNNAIETAQDITNIDWNDVISDAITRYISDNSTVENWLDSQVPKALKEGIELGRDLVNVRNPNNSDVCGLFGIDPVDTSAEDYPRGRQNQDYFRVIYTDDDSKIMYHMFYTVQNTTDIEYCNPPLRITGGVPYAQEDVVGGFLNVPESQLGAGYVYRNENGYLQLLDYDLLASGVLAYQLGEDFTCPSGLSSTEIQSYLDEYVNARIAFPNTSQLTNATDPYVIHVYINLSTEDTGYELSVNNIDSRFGTAVYLHVSGEANSSCILNIIKCQKLRLDLNISGTLTINLVDTELFYDADIIDQIEYISGLSLWYNKFNTDDADILVQGLSVEYVGTPYIVSNEEYWDLDSPNDNHYAYGLKGLTFDQRGNIVGAKLLVTDDVTGNVEEGTYLSTFEFAFPQSSGLAYPYSKITKKIKITGRFITAYPLTVEEGYLIKENDFSAITNAAGSTEGLTGLISFKTDISYVKRIHGIGSNILGSALLPNIDTWTPGEFHVFEGGTID